MRATQAQSCDACIRRRDRLKFETANSADPVRVPARQARLIVLPSVELAGAGVTPGKGGEASDFIIRSPSK